MRPVRFFLGCAIVLLALAAGLAGLAFVPAVQTWAARRFLQGRGGLGVGEVSAGLYDVEVRSLRVERDGAVLDVPLLQARLPLIPAALRGKLLLRRMSAHGWTLDLTHARLSAFRGPASPAAPFRNPSFGFLPKAYGDDAPAPAAAAFQGLLTRLRLPVGLELGGLDLEGTVLLPAVGDRSPARVAVSISGGGLEPDTPEGRFFFHGRTVLSGSQAAVTGLDFDGDLRAAMDSPRTFRRLRLAVAASAMGPKVAAGARLRGEFEGERDAGGETYSILLNGPSKQLADLRAEFFQASGRLEGTWKLDVGDDDLSPFALGRPLPVFLAQSEGRFETDAAFSALRADGQVTAMADRLEALFPGQPETGALKLTAAFGAAVRGRALRLDRLTLSIDGAHPVLAARALQAFEFDAGTGVLKVADPGRELLDVNLRGLPLDWLQPYLSGVRLSGGDLHGEILAGARDGGLVLRPKLPLTVEGLSVVRGGRTLVDRCDVLLSASGDYTPEGWQLTVSPFIARDPAGKFLELELMIGRLAGAGRPLKAAGRVDGDLPALFARAGATGVSALRGGGVTASFSTELGSTRSLQARLECRGLTAGAERPVRLPDLAVEARADQDANGRVVFAAPLEFRDADGTSKAGLSGSLAPSAGGWSLDALLSADSLEMGDVAALAALAGRSGASGDGTGSAGSRASSWEGGLAGRVRLKLGAVRGGPVPVSDVAGEFELEPSGIRIAELRAGVAGGQASLAGRLSFKAGLCALSANLAVSGIDSAPLFRAADPGRPPVIEGKFTIASRVEAQAADIASLPRNARGDLQISSKDGIFRLLSAGVLAAPADASKPGPLGSLLGDVTGAVAAVTGRKESAEAARGRSLTELSALVSEIHYDQLSATLARSSPPDLLVRDFSLISPDLRVTGSGRIAGADDRPWPQRPLAMEFSLRARDRAAGVLGRLGLLGAAKDELGYTACDVPLKVGGTLADPDASELRADLLKAALARNGGDLLQRLLGLK